MFRDVFGDKIPSKIRDVSVSYGTFYDISESPPKFIASYASIAKAITKGLIQIPNERTLPTNEEPWQESRKRTSIINNIVKRRKLWEAFIAKGTMNIGEFKKLSHFKPKAIAGFVYFLTFNGIATRKYDDFILNGKEIPHIHKILNDYSEEK